LPVRNVIPQPAIRGIGQRAGTNIIDLDFEIIDPDDVNATVGILAAEDGSFTDTSKWIVPQTWVDGTESKIGVPIATNQVHRVSWNVKGDWNSNTGTLKFEVLCRDARRVDSPVDLHFLELPLADGNLTISRSPLTDSDFETHFKYLLATGAPGIGMINGSLRTNRSAVPQGSTQYVFTNAGKEGREGPTSAEVNASYVGTNLEGQVGMSTQGIQEWTVPVSGNYAIEAVGARGGETFSLAGGYGAYASGTFSLTQGQKLKILVGQSGGNNGTNRATGGGGGTFVVLDQNNTPLVVAGGGGGSGHLIAGYDGTDSNDGGHGYCKTMNIADIGIGGTNGSGGTDKGGSGLIGNGASGGSLSFINGGLGGTAGNSGAGGGFGGGGGSYYHYGSGGGGGYSGGGGGGGVSNGEPRGQKAPGGGGGSYTADSNGTLTTGVNYNYAVVVITRITASSIGNTIGKSILSSDRKITKFGIDNFISALGHRYATVEEVTKAREAATPGSVNQWTATRQVKPRNLPGKVNEFGFDTERTPSDSARYWWVIEQQQ
jgi:hypothetical protein